MIHITGNTYTVEHPTIPDVVRSRRYKNLQKLLDGIDPSIPTHATFNDQLVEPFATPDGVGTLRVIYQGVPYVTHITP